MFDRKRRMGRTYSAGYTSLNGEFDLKERRDNVCTVCLFRRGSLI